ncbi:acyltransferase [Pseudalkalibacillus hwajinpoensis]|uniref:acyltransferase n=1 Tax=Guptibacillus hwajinpoensis TaxID=208199 RepID=UPI00325A8ACE
MKILTKIVKTQLNESSRRGVFITIIMNCSYLRGISRALFNKILFNSNIKASIFFQQKGTKIEVFNKEAKVVIEKFVFMRKNVSIRIDYDGKLMIGEKTFINDNCVINCINSISIGRNTKIAPNVCINDHDHNYNDSSNGSNLIKGEVKIGNNVWIGANVVILKNTTIGDNSVIGAGSVVKGVVPPNTLFINKREPKYISHSPIKSTKSS